MIELKVWHPRRPDPLDVGIQQLDGYLDGLGLDRGALIVFDRRPEAPPLVERTSLEQTSTPGGHMVTLIRA